MATPSIFELYVLCRKRCKYGCITYYLHIQSFYPFTKNLINLYLLILIHLIFFSKFFSESDLIPGLATFVACLILPLEIGILIGIGLNLVSILYHAARPKISIEIHKVKYIKYDIKNHLLCIGKFLIEKLISLQTRAGIEYLLITPDRCLIFPSVDYVRNLVTKHSMKKEIPVVIDCSHIYGADFTAAKVRCLIHSLYFSNSFNYFNFISPFVFICFTGY